MKFYLSQDQSSHWYVIPWKKRQEWEAWNELPEDDERAWEVPVWARPVNGDLSFVVFENPKIGGYIS